MQGRWHRGGLPQAGLPKDTRTVFLIIDGNNVAWAGFHSLKRAMEAETPEQFVRAGLLGLTQSVVGFLVRGGEPPAGQAHPESAKRRAPVTVTRLAVAFDEGRPLRRRSIFPAYQTGRESTPSFVENEKYVLEAIAQFIEMAKCLPIEIVRGKNTEADDLVAALLEQSDGDSVRICSTDRDFLQLVDERLSIYSPVKRQVIDLSNFTEATAPKDTSGALIPFPRERYLDYRVASGDSSDDLPGIPGVGATTAARLVGQAPLEAYLEDVHLVTKVLGRRSVKIEGAFRSGEAKDIIERNRLLMDLRLAAKNYPSLEGLLSKGEWDEGGFRAWVKDQRIAGLDIGAAVPALAVLAGATPAEGEVQKRLEM
jgi:DNA polymerase I